MKSSPRNHQERPLERRRGRKPATGENGPVWIWGTHASAATLANPNRVIHQVLATENAAHRMGLSEVETVSIKALDQALPGGAVHQVIAQRPALVAVLDQVADPHNLGAIFRSAAAFGVAGLVLQNRHAPSVTGIVGKSAAGAIETVAEVRVVNIARSLDALSAGGFTVTGLAGGGGVPLETAFAEASPVALVLGAEGTGLRPAVAKACDRLAHIPILAAMESLNVSNAAAIAFYEAARVNRTGPFSPE
ncbi:MAG: RNA methyltransferase [Pseudomonadota bacterium]